MQNENSRFLKVHPLCGEYQRRPCHNHREAGCSFPGEHPPIAKSEFFSPGDDEINLEKSSEAPAIEAFEEGPNLLEVSRTDFLIGQEPELIARV